MKAWAYPGFQKGACGSSDLQYRLPPTQTQIKQADIPKNHQWEVFLNPSRKKKPFLPHPFPSVLRGTFHPLCCCHFPQLNWDGGGEGVKEDCRAVPALLKLRCTWSQAWLEMEAAAGSLPLCLLPDQQEALGDQAKTRNPPLLLLSLAEHTCPLTLTGVGKSGSEASLWPQGRWRQQH